MPHHPFIVCPFIGILLPFVIQSDMFFVVSVFNFDPVDADNKIQSLPEY